MKIKLKKDVVLEALLKVDLEFNFNVEFKKCKMVANKNGWCYYNVTLKVIDSRKEGARIGVSGRRLNAACWHVYGRYIDNIFQLDEEAVVWTAKKKYTKDTWVWKDRNIGSILSPAYYSTLCKCV